MLQCPRATVANSIHAPVRILCGNVVISGQGLYFAQGRVRMDFLDKLVHDLMRKVRLPEDWQKDIERKVQNMDVVRKIEARRLEIDEELRRLGRAFADNAFSEDDYDRRRMKLMAENIALLFQMMRRHWNWECSWKTLAITSMMLPMTKRTGYPTYFLKRSITTLRKKQMIIFKPPAEYAPIFRVAAPLSGWTEKEGLVFSTSDDLQDHNIPDL